MAPEQREVTKQADHRADIFSLGVVFYEMLTGELPVGRWDPPSRKVQVDVRLDEIVIKALEANPERRYQRAAHMGTDVTRVRTGPAPAAPQPQSPTPPWAVFGCLAALLLPLGILLELSATGTGTGVFGMIGMTVLSLTVLFGGIRAVSRGKATASGIAGGCVVTALVGLALLILLPILMMRDSGNRDSKMRATVAEHRETALAAEVEQLLSYDSGVDPTYRLEKAEALVDQMDEDGVVHHRLMGRIEQERGRHLESIGESPMEEFNDAVVSFTRALQNAPDDFQSHLGRGKVHFLTARHLAKKKQDNTQELEDAKADLGRASQIDPDTADTWVWLGTVYADLGQSKDAVEKYTVAIRKAPQWTEPLIRRAQARLALGEHKDAAEDYEKAFRIDPSLDTGAVHDLYRKAKGEDF
jgi:hypothetical protein